MRLQWILFACFANLAAASAAGAETLVYTGANYATVSSGGTATPADMFTTADSLTGTLEFAAPLAANLTLATITPISFSFYDGVTTFTQANATSAVFQFSTDGAGAVTEWIVNVAIDAPTDGGGFNASFFTEDYSETDTTRNPPIKIHQVRSGELESQCGSSSTFGLGGCVLSGDSFYTQRAATAAGVSPGSWSAAPATPEVPLPAALPLFLAGLGGLGFAARNRRSSAHA